MIDKPPKITDEDKMNKSKEIAKSELSKIHRIMSGELRLSGIADAVEEDNVLPESPEKEEEKSRSRSVNGGTWHDRYYGNKDDTK